MEMPKYKTALIVGAGEGLSASLARLFAREGIKVALAARKIEKLGALCTETGARAFACDATEADEVERLFGLVEREIGTPDIVVYNASGRARGAFTDLVPADVAQAIAVSAFGGFLVAQQAAQRMLPNKHGAILFTGASASVKGYAQSAPFAMGKFALRGLAQSMARELSPQGIHVAHFVIDGGIRSAARTRTRRPAGLDARSRRDCAELLERAATAAQRLDLGTGIAAVGGEVLRHAVRVGKERSDVPTISAHAHVMVGTLRFAHPTESLAMTNNNNRGNHDHRNQDRHRHRRTAVRDPRPRRHHHAEPPRGAQRDVGQSDAGPAQHDQGLRRESAMSACCC